MSFEYTEIDKAKYADSVELLLYRNMDTNIKNIRYLLNIVNDLESKGVDKFLLRWSYINYFMSEQLESKLTLINYL